MRLTRQNHGSFRLFTAKSISLVQSSWKSAGVSDERPTRSQCPHLGVIANKAVLLAKYGFLAGLSCNLQPTTTAKAVAVVLVESFDATKCCIWLTPAAISRMR